MNTFTFFDRKGVIYVRLNGGTRQQRDRFSTKQATSRFNQDTQRCAGKDRDSLRVNTNLSRWERSLREASDISFSDFCRKAREIILNRVEVADEVMDTVKLSDYIRLYRKYGLPALSDSSQATMGSWFTHFDNWVNDCGDIPISGQKQSFINLAIKSYENYLRAIPLSTNSIHNVINGILVAVNYCVTELDMPHIKIKVPPKLEITVTSLPPEFIASWVSDLEEHYNSAETEREKTYIMYTALALQITGRVSDVTRLDMSNLIKHEGVYYVSHTVTQKRGRDSIAAISNVSAEIYKQRCRMYGSVFPPLDRRNINDWLRQHFKKFEELHTPIEVVTKESTSTRRHTKKVPLYKLVTTHMLRRSSASYMSYLGVPEGYIRNAGGWAPNSPMLSKYVATGKRFVNQAAVTSILNSFSKDQHDPSESESSLAAPQPAAPTE